MQSPRRARGSVQVAFIDANAHRDITAADIAAASFVTVRAVQLAFRRHLDTTPMACLRRTRLNSANHDLIAAAPGSTTVTDIAARWGFFRPSRFAEHYRPPTAHRRATP